jgi:CRISPR-associated protein Cmr3
MLGKMDPAGFSDQVVTNLKSMEIAGPLPLSNGSLFFPCPGDFVLRPKPRACFRLRPQALAPGDYCDLPDSRLQPAALPGNAGDEFKPEAPPAFWSAAKMAAWLLEHDFPPPPWGEDRKLSDGFLDALPRDERTHVKITAETGSAEEHMLFTTASLAFPDPIKIALRVSGADEFSIDALHPVGGERRLVHWEEGEKSPWLCPPAISQALASAPRIRMVLATPALFGGGWKPRWLNDRLEGVPPGTQVKLRLVAVASDRWRAVSGFGLERGAMGAKPIRRTVPAGGVYFFEYLEGDRGTLATSGWLAPVSDLAEDGQDQRDGFGLALWGTWNA